MSAKNKQNSIKQNNIPNSSKAASFPKPDFSPLREQELKYKYKVQGSYKKVKEEVPDSPNKTPINKFYTPAQIKGKNLFGTAPNYPFRKLKFDDVITDGKTGLIFDLNKNFSGLNSDISTETTQNSNTNNLDLIINEKDEESEEKEHTKDTKPLIGADKSKEKRDEREMYIKNGRFEKEYNVIRVISNDKYGSVSKVESNTDGEISCVKSVFKNSRKNSFKITKDLMENLGKLKATEPTSRFCVIYSDFWIEEEICELGEGGAHFTDRIMYIKYKYYKNGDLLDFLENLESKKFAFSADFYWDLIFEMICGVLYLHKCGFVHLNIKPPNFLVDSDGYIALNDFGLSITPDKLTENEDISEGDISYIAPEFFYKTSVKYIDFKSDVFSLGLTILELMAKIELPKSGPLWTNVRKENFEFPEEFLVNWNIKEINDFLPLIKDMILQLEKRLTLTEIIDKYPCLKLRYNNLTNKNAYVKSTSIPILKIEPRKYSLRAQPSAEDL